MKKNKRIVLFLFLVFLIPNIVYAQEYKSGDIKNPVITVEDENFIITKKVSSTDVEKIYDVEFKIKGKPTEIPLDKEVYVSILFDNSGSMLCKKGTKIESNNTFNKSTVINGQTLYCDAFDNINHDKWNNALNGAIDFSNDILNEIDNSKINLLTFSKNYSEKRAWSDEPLNNELFGFPYGATNLDLAVDAAVNKLKNISNDAIKNIVIISDGQPSNYDNAKKSIENAKKSNINIYTVGYNTTLNAENMLKEFSSGEGFYFNASIEGISDEMKKVLSSIKKNAYGSEVVIKDTIGKNFSFYSGDVNVSDNVVAYKINKIDSNEIFLNFKIKMEDNPMTGWHNTNEFFNNGVIVTYNDVNGDKKELLFDESSEVYYKRKKINYEINYYKDKIDDETFLGNVIGIMEKGDTLISNAVEKDKYLPVGYNSNDIKIDDIVLSDDNNVINIIYKKNKYPYHVEYYKNEISKINLVAKSKSFYMDYNSIVTDDILANDLGNNYLNLYIPDGYQKGVVLNSNHLITTGDNTIKVLYLKRDNLSYKIEYYFNNIRDDDKTVIINNQTYGNKIENLELLNFDYYEFEKVVNYPLTLSNDLSKNIIKVYYKTKENIVPPPKTDFSFPKIFLLKIPFLPDIKIEYNFVKQSKK